MIRARSRSILHALLLLVAFATSNAFAQALPGADLEIDLVTFGPGAIYWERFGHNAIVVRDRAQGSALAYNYGIFDFDEDDFLLNFARGRMTYRMAVDDYVDDVDIYTGEGRWIVEQTLALTPAQRAELATFLEWNARPENSRYRYDYFTANCSTRVRDALDRALGGALRRQLEGRSRGYTYRMDADRLVEPDFALMLGIDLGLGPFADRRLDYWAESFVPMTLMAAMREVRVAGDDGALVPLVARETKRYAGNLADPPDLPADLRWPFLMLGIVIGAALLALGARRNSRAARVVVGVFATSFALFCGLGGVVLALLWVATEHVSAWRNENLLLLNPLALLLIPAWIGSMRRAWRPSRLAHTIAWLLASLAAFALFSKVLPWFVQANLGWIVLFLPIHLALAIAVGRAASSDGPSAR